MFARRRPASQLHAVLAPPLVRELRPGGPGAPPAAPYRLCSVHAQRVLDVRGEWSGIEASGLVALGDRRLALIARFGRVGQVWRCAVFDLVGRPRRTDQLTDGARR
ncbi:Rv3235 family protein [Actinoalloteichus spitiensis]|uniref:Rv3235 family protein n=1 Tax=Actinoalloteichus spitiensis TaxID=252394 RepID=UPI00036349B3|nr:Rv3235 family protein [Actinoalloteichus spitiensis]